MDVTLAPLSNYYNSFFFLSKIFLLFFYSDSLIFLTRSILIPLVYGSYYYKFAFLYSICCLG